MIVSTDCIDTKARPSSFKLKNSTLIDLHTNIANALMMYVHPIHSPEKQSFKLTPNPNDLWIVQYLLIDFRNYGHSMNHNGLPEFSRYYVGA